jgi:LL-diaminopimelate aminotransferase
VELCPETEICPVIGSKEGLAHFPLAYLDPGDVALIPEPAYPEYQNGTMLAGGEPVFLPLLERNGFLPNLDAVKADDARRAKIIYANYPHNPTGAVAGEGFYRELLAFAGRHDLIVISDLAYSELGMEGPAPMSMLAVPGARERTIEFHSFSKTFNMTGWRVGFAAGSAELCAALGRVKSNVDSGIFTAIQLAAVEALEHYDEFIGPLRAMYQRRRDVFCDGLARLGLAAEKPKGAFYVWFPAPKGMKSAAAASRILEEADIVLTPGIGFGPSGEGYLRAALTVPEARLAEAVARLSRIRW